MRALSLLLIAVTAGLILGLRLTYVPGVSERYYFRDGNWHRQRYDNIGAGARK